MKKLGYENIKKALEEKGNFAIRTYQRGIAMRYTLENDCQELGLTCHFVHTVAEAMEDGIESAVQKAIENGAQVIVIDEPERLESEAAISEVIKTFERTDVKIVVAYFASGSFSQPGFDPKDILEKWFVENEVKIVDVEVQLV